MYIFHIPYTEIEKMVELLRRTKIEQIEYGGVIYARISDNNLILRDVYSGNDHSVEIIEKHQYGYGDIVGDFHTHLNTELPSFFDLDPMKNLADIKFIGGTKTNKIKCYIIKKIDIDLIKKLSELENKFYDAASKANQKNKDKILKEFCDIHDPLMNKLIDEYFDVIDINER